MAFHKVLPEQWQKTDSHDETKLGKLEAFILHTTLTHHFLAGQGFMYMNFSAKYKYSLKLLSTNSKRA